MEGYTNFINQIPEDIMQAVEKHLYSNIAIFKPDTFIAGKLMHSDDFHVVLSRTPPPDTYINGKLKSCSRGKIIIFNPDDTILVKKEVSKKRYTSLLLKPELLNTIAEEMGYSGPIKFLNFENPCSKELMHMINLFDQESEREDSFDLLMDCLAIQIATLLLRDFNTNLKKFPEGSPDMDIYINRSVEYIHTFYNANITINDICKVINVSPYHFIRTFKQKLGVSPHQYLLNLRIEKSKRYLIDNQYLISEIASLCGFVSLSHFSNTFKCMTGKSPSEYKKDSI